MIIPRTQMPQIPTEVLVRIMSYAFGPYREGRVVEQCWATDGPDCRGVQAKTLLPVGSIVKLQRSVMCDIGFLRALCFYDDEYGIEQTGWITVESQNNCTVYVEQILSVPLSNFVRAQLHSFGSSGAGFQHGSLAAARNRRDWQPTNVFSRTGHPCRQVLRPPLSMVGRISGKACKSSPVHQLHRFMHGTTMSPMR